MITQFQGRSLRNIVNSAKRAVVRYGRKRKSQKGLTVSLSNVKFVWQNPLEDEDSYFYWDKKSDDWYQRNFVEKREDNKPEKLPTKGSIIYPYTYAHRSRFHDNGFGYLFATVRALCQYKVSLKKILKTKSDFFDCLTYVSESVHLQNALASFLWLGRDLLKKFVEEPEIVQDLLSQTRQDSLLKLAQELKKEPGSRRLVTPSFVYSKVDQGLDETLGIPPYQLFQILPGRFNDPISSAHLHRSLDANGGIQLDYHHDLNWLKEFSKYTGRKIGSVTIFAGDFHIYLEDGENSQHLSSGKLIQDAIKLVTGAYESGYDNGLKLLTENGFYKRNARKVYSRLLE